MILAALLAAALAQPTPAQPTPAPQPAAAADQSPQAVLAKRLAAVRAQNTVSPMLVLVPNERAFLNALTQWRATASRAIFPVLIDDGSPDTRENIARFVRAFKPVRILRLAAPADAAPVIAADTQTTLYATFGVADEPRYLEVLNRRADAPGPIGVVASQADNPAGVALAAAYGQVLVITDPPSGSAGADYSLSAADKLSDTITAHLTVLKVPFLGLGDQVDAVTLCYDVPARVMVGKTDAPSNPVRELTAKPGEALSLTDIIGRDTTSRGTRWGYASQITGNHAAATYRAMCSIFLQPTSAAAFNGYERASEFGKYNPADAIAALKAAGLSTTLIDRPAQSAEDWRQWSSGSFATREVSGVTPPAGGGGALGNDFFLINTMGNSDFFQLQPGLCYAGDVPFLSLPAAVQFNHSWSLQFSGTPTTVGGRWLDRGAYVYVGSVHEPFLSAFVRPNDFVKRLTQGWPVAAAARILPTDKFDIAGGPPAHPFSAPWRIAVLGDALWTLGPALKRTTDLVPIPNSTDIGAELPKAGAAKNFAAVLDLLEILGRGADAAHWAQTLSNEPDKMDQATARHAILIAYRAGDKETVTKAAVRFIDAAPKEGGSFDAAVADAVWHALYPSLGTLTAQQANLLTHFIRPYSYVWDTGSAATALKRSITPEAARTFFDQQVHKAPDEFVRKRLEETRSNVLR